MRARLGGLWVALAALFSAGCPSCVDPEAGRHYACDRSAGAVEAQCPGGWVCTLDGVCADPEQGRRWTCQLPGDCTGGWHCGVAGLCYDRADAGEVACRLDQQDCGPGWTCGLEERCHPVDQGAAYRCDGEDRWCTEGWRCGSEGRCVDTRISRLRPAPDPAALDRSRLAPGYDPTTVTSFAGSLALATGQGTGRLGLGTDGGILMLELRPVASPDEPVQARQGFIPLQRLDGGLPTSMAAVRDDLYAVAGGTLYRMGFDAAGAPRVAEERTAFKVTGMDELRQTVAVFPFEFGSAFTLRSRNDGGTGFVNFSSTVSEVTDFRSLDSMAEEPAELFVASTARGLFLSERVPSAATDGGPAFPTLWFALPLPGVPHADCGGTLGIIPTKLRAMVGGGTAVLALAQGEDVSLFVSATADTTLPCDSAGFSRYFGPAPLCPAGSRLEELAFGLTTELIPFAHCVDFSGRATTWRLGVDGGVEPLLEDPLPPTPLRWSTINSTMRLAMDSQGGISNCAAKPLQGGSAVCTPLTLPGGPELMAGSSSGRLQARVGGATFENLPGFHLVPHSQSQLCGSVKGAPSLGIQCPFPEVRVADLETGLLKGAAPVSHPVNARNPPVGAIAHPVDGGQLLVLAVEDTVWSGPGLELDARALPIVHEAVTALAFPDSTPADAGLYVEGYAISQERVFRLRATSTNQWRTQEVLLPGGVARWVWFDDTRGRVAFADGRVFSLPDGTLIGPPLEGMVASAELCGHGYALDSQRLLQLSTNPDGGAVGAWREVPLPGFNLPGAERFLEAGGGGGALHAAGNELLVVTARGTVLRVTDPACP